MDELESKLAMYAFIAKVESERKEKKEAKGEGGPAKVEKKEDKKDDKKKESSAPAVKKEATPEIMENFASLKQVGEECLEEAELLQLLINRPGNFRLYDGFEPSGRLHIAQGIFKALNVNTCTKAGGEFVFWVADFFALMNDKMGGDLKKIRVVGEYLVEAWKAAGMNMERVKFIWASEEIVARAEVYARIVADIARRFTVARLVKCCQIMGRKEGNLSAAQILYPIMQCADIFFLQADICQLGMDQRKVNMLARDYAQVAERKFKPIILSHHMMFGLKQGQEKMSKSDPDSAIFMEDSKEDVARKIRNAYCPRDDSIAQSSEDVILNPCLDYVKSIVFKRPGGSFLGMKSFVEVKQAFLRGDLEEEALKNELVRQINELLDPVRTHFATGEAKELLDKIKQYKQEDLDKKNEAARRAEADMMDLEEDVVAPRRRKEAAAPMMRVVMFPEKKRVIVCASPIEKPRIALAELFGCAQRLFTALQSVKEDEEVVFLIDDLGMICLNCLGDADNVKKRKLTDKAPFAEVGKNSSPTLEIEAYWTLFTTGLRAVLGAEMFSRVRVVRQSEIMLKDPMSFWISVINVGRAFKLDKVLHAVGLSNDQEGGRVGAVIDALMHVGNILALSPVSTVYSDGKRDDVHSLALDFFESDFARKYDAIEPFLKVAVPNPDLRLFANVDGDPELQNLNLFDTDKDIQTKIKRSFCEEGNVAKCPAIHGLLSEVVLRKKDLLSHMGAALGSHLLEVKRSEANGGDVVFESVKEVVDAFAAKTLHPGDLKASLSPLVVTVMAHIRKQMNEKDLDTKVLLECKKRQEI